jgi:FtsZ-binding cell division protein ZapB
LTSINLKKFDIEQFFLFKKEIEEIKDDNRKLNNEVEYYVKMKENNYYKM